MKQKNWIALIFLLAIIILLSYFVFFRKPDCSTLITPAELKNVCGIEIGEGKPERYMSQLCGLYWRSGDIAVFHISVYSANYYTTALSFDYDQIKQLSYSNATVTETNEFGEASYIFESNWLNRLFFKQGPYTVLIHSQKQLCNLEQLKVLGGIVEKKIKELQG